MANRAVAVSHRTKLSAAQLQLLLRPLIKAYVLGYASSTTPQLLTVLVSLITRKPKAGQDSRLKHAAIRLYEILRNSLHIQRFPAFCAAIIGGATLLKIPIGALFSRTSLSTTSKERLTSWTASFIAGWFSMRLLQGKDSEAFIERKVADDGLSVLTTKWAGRTMDLTCFAVVRAMDVIVGELWARRKAYLTSVNRWGRLDEFVSYIADTALFSASSVLVMWAWFYLPEKLPRAYNKWITGAAQLDMRLIKALRLFRWGELIYGRETGQRETITSMCRDYGHPLEWGDPTKTWPFPCEIVHMGLGPSCEYHAWTRFSKGFWTGIAMYGSINSVMFLVKPSVASAKRAAITSIRSSAFIGSFIALFYYGVCLTRCRVGPKVLGPDPKAAQRIDSGLCVQVGCSMCGWSIMLENEGRRKDIALFVAPRALATFLPRRYELKDQWKETLAFAMSAAVLLTCAQENPKRVRGVFGKVLGNVFGSK